MRQLTPNEQDGAILRYGTARRELCRVHSAVDNVSPRLSRMAVCNPAVFADMKVPMIPTVGGNITGYVPTPSTQVTNIDPAARKAADRRRKAARNNMLLM